MKEANKDKKSSTLISLNELNPIIQDAYSEGRLAVASEIDFYSTDGIPLPNKSNLVVALYYPPPMGTNKTVLNLNAENKEFSQDMPQFEGGEHDFIGNQATIYLYHGSPGQRAADIPLTLPNGLEFTYGQVLALGGDFYGIPSQPISDGSTPAYRQQRFHAAFNTLATSGAAADQANAIFDVMRTEISAVNAALRKGEPASSAYKALGDRLSESWNRITGGGSRVSPWIPLGRYLELARTNWDHFGHHAVLAYIAGHSYALSLAAQARDAATQQQQIAEMEVAYAANAFADHFLSDIFSAGHMRTPRKLLHEVVTPSDSGDYLSRFMHDEDCANGLNVQNDRGNSWKAYGDKRYFDMNDIKNAVLVNQAVQFSADEVYEALQTGSPAQPGDYAALLLIPDLALLDNYANTTNYVPMFANSNNAVIRRDDLNSVTNRTWKTDWWGSTTLSILGSPYYSGPTFQIGPMKPPTRALGIQTNGWKSQTPVPPNWVTGNKVRYAVTFVCGLDETNPGPWNAWTTLHDEFFPTLENIPIEPTGTATSRNIYRQFGNKMYEYIGAIANNTDTTFVDNHD